MVSFSTKRLLLAIVAVLSTGAAVVDAACVGTSDADIPYTISSTKTGDGKSTSFYGLICGLGCADGAVCSDLTSVSIGGVALGGGDSSDDCGTVFDIGLSPDGGCQTFSFTADQSGIDLDSVCPNGCHVRFNLANGDSIVRTIGGDRVDTPTASPVPEVSPSPSPTEVPSMEPSSGTDIVTPSANNSPRPYGSMRRRNLHQYGGARRLNQYGSGRRLNQY